MQLHTLERAPEGLATPMRARSTMRRHPDTATLPVQSHTTMFTCHKGRVKVGARSDTCACVMLPKRILFWVDPMCRTAALERVTWVAGSAARHWSGCQFNM